MKRRSVPVIVFIMVAFFESLLPIGRDGLFGLFVLISFTGFGISCIYVLVIQLINPLIGFPAEREI